MEVDCEDYFITMQVLVIGDLVINEGDWISLNGSTGEVILGKQPLSPPALSGDLEIFMSWADQIRRLKVLDTIALTNSKFIVIVFCLFHLNL